MSLDLLYFVNPMCSWCYGFGPSLRGVQTAFAADVAITVALGALREDTEPLRPEQKDYLRTAWRRVAEASGQPFTFDLLDRDDFAYDTRPACQAVLAVRDFAPATLLDYLEAVQAAFYRDNRDVTDAAVLCDLAEDVGLDRARVEAALTDPASAEALVAEYQQVARMGVHGYPMLVAVTQPHTIIITQGFQPPEPVNAAVRDALGKVTG